MVKEHWILKSLCKFCSLLVDFLLQRPNKASYHSTPFFLEMNGNPEFRNVTGLMVDNYSQVAIDLGKNNSSTIGVATRFGTFDTYIMTDDNVPRMIW